jgi:hypothetical protein
LGWNDPDDAEVDRRWSNLEVAVRFDPWLERDMT